MLSDFSKYYWIYKYFVNFFTKSTQQDHDEDKLINSVCYHNLRKWACFLKVWIFSCYLTTVSILSSSFVDLSHKIYIILIIVTNPFWLLLFEDLLAFFSHFARCFTIFFLVLFLVHQQHSRSASDLILVTIRFPRVKWGIESVRKIEILTFDWFFSA